MELTWKLDQVPRSGSATVRVTDLGWQGLLNPSPSIKDDGELLVDEYLSPSKLQALTGLDDLQQVRALEMRVDTRENSLGNFGAYLPNLKQLKLNNSMLTSVRDLGTALSHLQVLWMVRCGLSDLDGISSCCSLKELYIAYNNIADLSPVSLLEHLEILDLEGNNIEELGQVQYLGLCTKLTTLTMEGNLVCLKPSPKTSEVTDYNYRAEVKKLIPHLKSLDEVPANQTDIPVPCKMNKDWLIVKESIKDGSLVEEASGFDSYSGSVTRRPCSAGRPATSNFLSASRPQTAQRPPSAHLLSSNNTLTESTISDDIVPEDDSSDLTHGVSKVICGNPIKALHARRQKLGSTVMNLFQPQCHTHDYQETNDVNVEEIFAELNIWTEQHNQYPPTIPREKSLQILKIIHSDEEEEEWSLSDSCEEDSKEMNNEDLIEKMSPDSSYQSSVSQSSSDSFHALENALPTLIKHPLVPSPPKCPSPASIQGVKDGLIRARRLKVPSSTEVALLKPTSSAVNRDALQHVVEKTTVFSLFRKPDASSNVSALGPKYRHCGSNNKPTRRPVSGPAATGSTDIRATVDKKLHKMISPHHPVVHSGIKTSETFAMLNVGRPLSAKAALQSLPSRPNISMIAQSKFPKL
ncbi:leucine-rich repeat-containing protein 56 [Eublepharis macularius]|uniref:Leucine-rich repeat-containing protein 56 n=1 Tax=Eublepharis macularius TaxID=481883 RepID=A0AA97IV93_EUBMA|nr:leucine-rich repeat-containing protein 56 [Eublepharis macularius]XP_054826177.1 leucine-rich repeat-containing protein 56 [Eublepharis macularius]XP_054826178.1 leucine-rich repeat-containing protein 56 [Eublepharis macularius]